MKISNITKQTILPIALSFVLPSAFSFDFGGVIKNDSDYKSNAEGEFNLDQQNALSLWARQNFDKSGNSYFTVEGVYNFEADLEQENNDDRYSQNVDVNMLAVNLASGGNNFEAGRFFFYDVTSLILAQTADGARFDFQNDYVTLSAYGAYTGLLNAINTSIINATPAQFTATGDAPAIQDSSKIFNSDSTKLYDLQEKYLISGVTFSLPYFLANQTFTAEFTGAFRLQDEKYNRMYVTAAFNGPVYQSLYYNLSSTLGIINYKDNDSSETEFSNLSRLSFDYYIGKGSLNLNAVYASGNQGSLSPFVGFTKNTSTSSLQEYLYTGIVKGGLSASLKPTNELLFAAGADAVFNAMAGDSTDEDLRGFEYYGFQCSASATYQLMSDLQLGLSFTQFIDKDNTDAAKKTYLNFHVSLAF